MIAGASLGHIHHVAHASGGMDELWREVVIYLARSRRIATSITLVSLSKFMSQT
jgi:hypothetical protein